MKTYCIRESVKKLYYAAGVFFAAVAVLVLIVRPLHYAAMFENILVYVFVLMLAALSLLRPRTCRLTLDEKELCFHDGMLGHTSVALDHISKIEWSPEIRIRVYTDPAKKKAVKIPNVFSPEDTAEIFSAIQKQKETIQIIRLGISNH
ncbi:hypothetical protein [Caproiciproducens sp.]